MFLHAKTCSDGIVKGLDKISFRQLFVSTGKLYGIPIYGTKKFFLFKAEFRFREVPLPQVLL